MVELRIRKGEIKLCSELRDMEFWFPLIEDKNLLEVARGKALLVKTALSFGS